MTLLHPETARQRLRRRLGLIITGFVVCGLFIAGLLLQQLRFDEQLEQVQREARAQQRSGEEERRDLQRRLQREVEESAPIDVERVTTGAAPSVFAVADGQAGGTGFALMRTDDSVLVVTNRHVVERSLRRRPHPGRVTLVSGRDRQPARVWAEDATTDLAIVELPGTQWPLLEHAWSDGNDAPHVGDEVVAYGNPLGIPDVATSGVISQLDGGAILSDVSVNPGNSGGPLLDRDGNVIGVVSANIAPPGGSGLALAIEIPYVCQLALATDQSIEGCEGVPLPPPA